MIVLCTVPGSGTVFFRELLEQHFRPLSHDEAAEGQDGVWATHADARAIAIIDVHKPILVTTTRDKAAVMLTAERNNRPLESMERYYHYWEMVLERNPIIVSIEQGREQRLKVLEQRLGVQFKTDWTPVNTTDGRIEKQKRENERRQAERRKKLKSHRRRR